MKSIKGPAIFLAQFAGDKAPFNTFDSICGWAAKLGYKGVQIPAWDSRFIDLKKAASSIGYCEELIGTAKKHGVEITELATHLQGQLVAVNPVYDEAFDAFAAASVRGNPKKRQQWATEQVTLAAKASRNMGLGAHVTFSGALAWPFLYPWPPLPAGLIEAAFDELARRWRPILDAHEEQGVDLCFELHPGEDLFEARRSSASLTSSRATNAAASTTTRHTSGCRHSTTLVSSMSITNVLKRFTSRTPSFGRRRSRASIRASLTGPIAPGASAHSATAMSTSAPFSRAFPCTATTAGRFSSGNARSRTGRTARARARNSSRSTSSK